MDYMIQIKHLSYYFSTVALQKIPSILKIVRLLHFCQSCGLQNSYKGIFNLYFLKSKQYYTSCLNGYGHKLFCCIFCPFFSRKRVMFVISRTAYCFILKFLVKTHIWHCWLMRSVYFIFQTQRQQCHNIFTLRSNNIKNYLAKKCHSQPSLSPKSLLLIIIFGIIPQSVAEKIICTYMLLECCVKNKTLHIINKMLF